MKADKKVVKNWSHNGSNVGPNNWNIKPIVVGSKKYQKKSSSTIIDNNRKGQKLRENVFAITYNGSEHSGCKITGRIDSIATIVTKTNTNVQDHKSGSLKKWVLILT